MKAFVSVSVGVNQKKGQFRYDKEQKLDYADFWKMSLITVPSHKSTKKKQTNIKNNHGNE